MTDLNRRPIAAREAKLSKRVATFLARKSITANQISIAGMVFGIVGGICLAATSQVNSSGLWFAAGTLGILRLLANMFDGMVAIETGTASPMGEIYNELPDRISDSAFLIGLGFAYDSEVSWGLTAALLAMLTAYVRTLGRCAGANSVFSGMMAKQQRMAMVIGLSFLNGVLIPMDRLIPSLNIYILIFITAGCVHTSLHRLKVIRNQLIASSRSV